MSWFDTAGIASFAKTALTTAQKTLDKALDLQEETERKSEKQTDIVPADPDNFFGTFGLSEQPSTSQPVVKVPRQQNAPPYSQIPASSQASGFWTETWGSFFPLTPSPNSDVQNLVSKKEALTENTKSDRNTVLSQPHRTSPFIDDSTSGQEAQMVKSKIEEVVEVEPMEMILEEVTKDVLSTNLNDESSSIVMDEQPSNNAIISPKRKEILISSSSEAGDTSVQKNLTEDKANIVHCDTEIKVQNSSETVPKPTLKLGDGCSAGIDESAYCTVNKPVSTSCNLEKSEYDVIEMTDSDVSNNLMERSSDSFTRSTSVEVVTSMSQSYDISRSTVEIPDLPESMAENIVSWDWSAMEQQTRSELYETPSDNSCLHATHDSADLDLLTSSSSFHTITASSFSDNQAWDKSENSSHLKEVKDRPSKSAADQEQISHHSDESSSNNSSKGDDDTDTAEVKEYDTKSSSSCCSHATSSSSFVKCSVDGTDNSSHRGLSPTSTTASDVTKHESEQNTSGDENETATSSDIEILSPPNGENGNSSPLKHIFLSKSLRLQGSESPVSNCSNNNLSVDASGETYFSGDCKSFNDLYSKETTLTYQKELNEESYHKLQQKYEELQTILDAREKKIVEMSKENIDLQENEQRLKNMVQKMRMEQAKESRDIAALTKEFTQRLSLVESRLKETTKERDSLQLEVEQSKEEIAKRICATDIEEVMQEKDVQIKELIEEGQKLSKKELHHTTIIKKLRAKEEEMDKTIKSQAEKLEDNSKEVERLRKSIGAKEEQEKKHIEAIRQLTNTVRKLEKEVATLKSSLEDSTEKELSLKLSLDSTYKDLTELRKLYASKEKEIQDLKSGLEVEANENLQHKLDVAVKEATKEKEMLLLQIQELRSTLSRAEEEANMREKMYRADIATLQKRLQEAEERNEDLTKNVSSATRPLVRQIENLQSTYNAQTISWEKIEKNLTDRLSDAQNQLALMSEKERSVTEKYMENQSRVTVLETQNNALRQENLKLSAEVDSLTAKIMMLEESKSRESYKLEKVKENFNVEIEKVKKEKVEVEKTMSTCLEQLDLEKKRVFKLEEEIKFKDTRAMIFGSSSRGSSPTGSVNSIHNWSQDDLPEHGTSTPVIGHRMSVYDSLMLGSGSSVLENLQSQLKQREGEIMQLQSEIFKLEKVKESMTRELVLLSEQNEEHEVRLNKLESVEKEYKDLDQKYNTLLQMYGEKVEQAEELQLDLDDVKSMYKAQIQELLQNK